ncbi:methionine--tRNA ligase [bacterium]|nr:methionine--tRNA ligase [bacterium]
MAPRPTRSLGDLGGSGTRAYEEMKNDDNKYYITTPIYYVNSKPHVGTSYTTIIADIAARFHRFMGAEVLMVTGSDEHSQNIVDLAAEAGKSPREFCDEIVPSFKETWSETQIQDYRFVRTSDPRHHRLVRTFWQRIYDKGDVYLGEYSGWYHTSDNRFLDEDEVPEDPQGDPLLKYLTEDSYYFRLSNYQGWLMEFHQANEGFIVPGFRRNEMLNRIKEGLKDIVISRTSTDWGVKLPWDEGHVLYVWVDALLAYMTGSGFDIDAFEKTFVNGKSSEVREPAWETTRGDLKSQPADNFWPCDLHTMAKDIPWFHAVIWPAILQSYGAPPPKQELVHGYWNFGGEKMSKSLGNVVDPHVAMEFAGADGLRYFLAREVPLGLDGNFSHDALIRRYNYDLANDLGNLVHRTVSMLHQLFEGTVPEELAVTELDEHMEEQRRETIEPVLKAYEEMRYSEALQAIWALIGEANKYIDEKKPWELKKKPKRRDEISTVFARLCNTIRTVLLLSYPVIPGSANRLWRILGLPGTMEEQQRSALDGTIPRGHRVNPSQPVFQRVDIKAHAAKEAGSEPAPPVQQAGSEGSAALRGGGSKDGGYGDPPHQKPFGIVTIEDFAKLELKTAVVREAERVEKTDRLLHLLVFDGERDRQIVAGIAEHYSPEELIGKTIVVVVNLAPRKLRGLLSEGMLLAVDGADGLSLITPERPTPAGVKVK